MSLSDYEEGALAALEILKATRAKHEAPLRKAEVGAAYVALNACSHWGQAICSDAETAVLKHLMDRKAKP